MKEAFQSLNVNGLRMHMMSAGEGPAVVLLHGFPDTHVVWRKQVGPLVEAGFRVIAPDLRGYGQTDAPMPVSAYRMEHLCTDVLGLLDALDLPRARIVGHDWGAVIGWELCMRAPQRIEQYVSLSVGHPAAFARSGLLQYLRSSYMLWFMMPVLAEKSLMARDFHLMEGFTSDPTQVRYWRKSLSEPGRMTAALNYYRANVPRALMIAGNSGPVQVPVMGIWSNLDPALGEAQMRDSAAYVDGPFRYERIDGADHWVQLTAAERVNALLLDFFGKPGGMAPAAAAEEAPLL